MARKGWESFADAARRVLVGQDFRTVWGVLQDLKVYCTDTLYLIILGIRRGLRAGV